MRAVIQRVSEARVSVAGTVRDQIGSGLLVLVAAEEGDTPDDLEWLSGKIARLRIFSDEAGLMNRSVGEAGGAVMVISQFTLLASTRKGNRPSFLRSAKPETAVPLYEQFLNRLETDLGRRVARGEFGADMQISLVNDGPVTLIIDSRQRE
ncbi:MAG TPA: D-aminoacyl-tRNA deacylase [Verrucomicrobiae bacterium]|nr:D-aminoacyl-tRNA deacylase [Verrucomicrobiae bacterium]